ncbi:cytochrome P450 [Nocardia vinacea]|uniref:Cytochrome P450 n=1 Tax=Nocardia vinacea TaxID=96468 RepID=A0ABZ1YU01_9NOCA|nr:cytochrome P450 [Nocardia vinacea]
MVPEPITAPSTMNIDFDHTDPAFIQNPYDTVRTLLRECPVARSTKFGGFWVLSRYQDLIAAARDTETFCSGQGVSLPVFGSPVPMVPVEADPPAHSAFRKILQREFTRTRMVAMEQSIRDLTNRLIDGFVDRGHGDLSTELALPIPPIVIAELLGLPDSDWERFYAYTQKMIDAAKNDDLEANIEAALEFCTYLAQTLDDRRAEPRDDMLTRLVQAEVDGRLLTEDEALGMCLLIVVAGHETTVGGISSLLMHVARDPELKLQLLDDPTLIPKAVEETLRLDPPLQGMARTVTKDVNVGDQWLREGDKVWLLWTAGNRDPEQFENADKFDLDRRPNRHLSFGEGAHRCIGAPLAQVEMRVVLEEVLRRIPDFEVTDWNAVTFGGGQSRHVGHLPVHWGS